MKLFCAEWNNVEYYPTGLGYITNIFSDRWVIRMGNLPGIINYHPDTKILCYFTKDIKRKDEITRCINIISNWVNDYNPKKYYE